MEGPNGPRLGGRRRDLAASPLERPGPLNTPASKQTGAWCAWQQTSCYGYESCIQKNIEQHMNVTEAQSITFKVTYIG